MKLEHVRAIQYHLFCREVRFISPLLLWWGCTPCWTGYIRFNMSLGGVEKSYYVALSEVSWDGPWTKQSDRTEQASRSPEGHVGTSAPSAGGLM